MLPFLFLHAALAAEPRHLSPDEALALLESGNPSIARADAAVQTADGASVVALSGAMPTLSVGGGYTRNNAEVTLDLGAVLDAIAAATGQTPPDGPGVVVLQPLDALTGSATVRVPLLAPAAWAGYAASRDGVDAARANAEAARSSVRGAALQAFWAEAAAESLVEAQTNTLERARALAAQAERALAAGTGTRLGVLTAQTELARREGELLGAIAARDRARVAVGTLLGEDVPVAVDMPTVAAPVALTASVEDALAQRGEMQAATSAVQAAQRSVLSARLGAVPTVSGSFSAFASTEAYPTGDKTGWKATVDLSWPLIAGGSRYGAVQKAQGSLAEAAASRDALSLQISQQVRDAEANVGVAAARLETAQHARALAEEAATVAQRSFDEGLIETAAVLDALDRLDLARAGEIDAIARVGMAEAALRAATSQW